MSMTGKFELHTLLLMNEFRKFPEIGSSTKPNRDTAWELPQVREE